MVQKVEEEEDCIDDEVANLISTSSIFGLEANLSKVQSVDLTLLSILQVNDGITASGGLTAVLSIVY